MNYFIADQHYGHKNVLSFDNRGFTDIESHDKYLSDSQYTAVEWKTLFTYLEISPG